MIRRRRLGRYELLAPIARGGMAVVWAARKAGAGDETPTVAIKTLLPELSLDQRCQKMFLSEARLAAKIEHPNVCAVFDSGDDSGTLYLAMEWLSGESLATLLADLGGRLPCGIAARIALDVARGLEAVHAQTSEDGNPLGIVHRDVSPQNIVVTAAGMAKVLDFGVAEVKAVEERLTQSGHLSGKVGYMSPEQVYCEEVDSRSDVFSLGVVLYEATTGKHPFSADAQLGTLLNISSPEPAAPPHSVIADYPESLGRLVMTAIDKDPERRFPSMRAFAAALEPVLQELRGGHREVQRYFAAATARRAELRASLIREGAARTAETLAELPALRRSGAGRGRGVWLGAALIPAVFLLGAFAWYRGVAPSAPETPRANASAAAPAVLGEPVRAAAALSEPLKPLGEAKLETPGAPSAIASAQPPRPQSKPAKSEPRPMALGRPPEDVLKNRD